MVKRYTEGGYGVSEMEEDQNGGWVRYEDHLKEISKIRQQFIATEAGGWIAWGGGECPVDAAQVVDVKWRAGGVMKVEAGGRTWFHDGKFYDIIAYRVIENDGREG
ncbi:hypothetical protein AC790_13420 [Pantoea sp. RIT-PI-b]|uniref:hypothetical protein n=1 Tax=Pantoea sp. RIT-PI-b TaxID=1681195 RepID=UPI000676B00A|nr:hypothetical protein [Pantoea sp. RIT-PI-b]KNC11563.1 hypothetical protein AC790_13420 [Pantoea sp. RIT-PI-b]